MQEITEKLRQQAIENFYPLAESLAKEGLNPDEIATVFHKQVGLKVQQFYKGKHSPRPVKEIIGDVAAFVDKQRADSKAETVFYNMLSENGLKFDFQYRIGPYSADYLFAGFLVVELDGPQHTKEHDDKRDQYMRKMGYKVIRVPIWILASFPEDVLEEIKDALNKQAAKKKKLRRIK